MPLVATRHDTGDLWRVERGCLDETLLDELRTEARAVRSNASVRDFVEPHLTPEGRLYSQTLHWVGEPGPVLESLHESEWLVSLLAEFVGNRVFPTRGAYIYYDVQGSVGLHTDVGACTSSALVPIDTPSDEELVVHSELVGVPAIELLGLSVDSAGHPSGGTRVSYPTDGVVLVQGNSLPHHRPPCAQPVTIAALCFDSLR